MSINPTALENMFANAVPSVDGSASASRAESASAVPSVVFDHGEFSTAPTVIGGGGVNLYSIARLGRPAELCCGLLRNNESFCVKESVACTANHQGDGDQPLPAVSIGLAKTKDAVFSKPLLDPSTVDSTLLTYWTNEKKTKFEWNKEFDLVRTIYSRDCVPVTLVSLEVKIEDVLEAKKAPKTPGKAKRSLTYLGNS